MGFYFSKENREKRANEKELKRQKEFEEKERLRKENESKKEFEEKRKREYCVWYSSQTQNFINELHNNNCYPTWGFEVETEYNTQLGEGGKQYSNIFVFDIPEIEGLAFDMNSKQMVYYTCPTGYYDKYENPNTQMEYKYTIIPFSDIFNASVEVNSQTTISTVTSKQNVIGRSIVGGILAGDVGAIIGGTTGKNSSISKSEILPKKIVLNIQTTKDDCPIISFEFNKPYNASGEVAADKSMADTMYGIFSDEKELATFYEREQKRNCNTNMDYHYHRLHGSPDHDGNNPKEYQPILDYIFSFANLEIILKRVNKYAMQIESIIQQCNKENHYNDNSKSKDIIAELSKLADMKEKGLITNDEFVKFKSKLI